MKIPKYLIQYLDEMLYELYTERLEVCLIPSTDKECAANGGMIRACCNSNPDWYQNICSHYPSTRKRKNDLFDTRVKRQHILKTLERMIRNKKSKSKYAPDLLQVASDRFELYERLQKEEIIPWDNQF